MNVQKLFLWTVPDISAKHWTPADQKGITKISGKGVEGFSVDTFIHLSVHVNVRFGGKEQKVCAVCLNAEMP